MHCPNCATKVSGEQKFCRTCGLKLEKVYELLSEELSTAELHTENQIRRFEHWRNVAGLWTVATFVIVLLVVFIREVLKNIETGSPKLYASLIGLALFLGVVIALSFGAYSAYLRQKLATRKMQQSLARPDAAQTATLPAEAQSVEMSSITEHTTAILETDLPEGGDHRHPPAVAPRLR